MRNSALNKKVGAPGASTKQERPGMLFMLPGSTINWLITRYLFLYVHLFSFLPALDIFETFFAPALVAEPVLEPAAWLAAEFSAGLPEAFA